MRAVEERTEQGNKGHITILKRKKVLARDETFSFNLLLKRILLRLWSVIQR